MLILISRERLHSVRKRKYPGNITDKNSKPRMNVNIEEEKYRNIEGNIFREKIKVWRFIWNLSMLTLDYPLSWLTFIPNDRAVLRIQVLYYTGVKIFEFCDVFTLFIVDSYVDSSKYKSLQSFYAICDNNDIFSIYEYLLTLN